MQFFCHPNTRTLIWYCGPHKRRRKKGLFFLHQTGIQFQESGSFFPPKFPGYWTHLTYLRQSPLAELHSVLIILFLFHPLRPPPLCLVPPAPGGRLVSATVLDVLGCGLGLTSGRPWQWEGRRRGRPSPSRPCLPLQVTPQPFAPEARPPPPLLLQPGILPGSLRGVSLSLYTCCGMESPGVPSFLTSVLPLFTYTPSIKPGKEPWGSCGDRHSSAELYLPQLLVRPTSPPPPLAPTHPPPLPFQP